MPAFLWDLIYVLGWIIGSLVMIFLTREIVIVHKKKQWLQKKEKCLNLLGNLKEIEPSELLSVIFELKNSFPESLIESVLDEIRVINSESNEIDAKVKLFKENIARVYSSFGFLDKYLDTLKTSEIWLDRVHAIDTVGQIGHVKALEPILERLFDKEEEQEVRNASIMALSHIINLSNFNDVVKLFDDCEPFIAEAVSNIFINLGPPIIAPLIERLTSSKNESMRFWIVRILGNFPTIESVNALLKSLEDYSAKVRAEAANSLKNVKSEEASIPLVKRLLRDPSSFVRSASAEALGSLAGQRDLDFLMDSLSILDEPSRLKVISAIETMGDKSIPFFLSALEDKNENIVREAAVSIERIGLLQKWVAMLESEDSHSAYDNLVKVAKADVVEGISRSLFNKNSKTRLLLCKILSNTKSKKPIPELSKIVENDSEAEVRRQALLTLSVMDPLAAAPLIKTSLQKDLENRVHILKLLQESSLEIIRLSKEEVSYFLDEIDDNVRLESLKVITKLTYEAPFLTLIRLTQDSSEKVREECAAVLGSFKEDKSIESLHNLLEDSSKNVRVSSIRSLGQIGHESSIIPLTRSYETSDDTYKMEISKALSRIPKEKFFNKMDFLMAQSHPKVRSGIASTLGMIGDKEYFDLLKVFLYDANYTIRLSAAEAISKFDKIHAVPILLNMLNDPNAELRNTTTQCLRPYIDIQIAERLISHFSIEPDKAVQKELIVTISHCPFDNTEKCEYLRAKFKEKLNKWSEYCADEEDRTIAIICLGAIGDKDAFEVILNFMKDRNGYEPFKESLKKLTFELQKKLFAFFNLDQAIFWKSCNKDDIENYYIDVLQADLNESNRLQALRILEVLGCEQYLAVLKNSKNKDPSPQIRANCLRMIRPFISDRDMFSEIISLIKDPSPLVIKNAVLHLKELNVDQIVSQREKLLFLLDVDLEGLYGDVGEILSKLYRKDWDTLVDSVLADSKNTRIKCLIKVIAFINDPKVVELIKQFLSCQDLDIRKLAADTASSSNILSNSEWFQYLQDPLENIRISAVRALGRNLDENAYNQLKRASQDPSAYVRMEFAWALSQLDILSSIDFKEEALTLSEDKSTNVKIVSFLSLYRLGCESSVSENIRKYFDSSNERDKSYLLKFLKDKSVLQKLLKDMRHDSSSFVRKEALTILSILDLQGYKNEILKSLSDLNNEVRFAAVEALYSLQDHEIQEAISNLKNDPSQVIQQFFSAKHIDIGTG